MLRMIGRRLLALIATTWAATLLVFLVINVLPGDAAAAVVVGQGVTPEQLEALREQLGLNEPLLAQYLAFLLGLLRGDLGYSYLTDQPITQAIAERLPATLQLTMTSLVVGIALGALLAFFSSLKPGSAGVRIGNGALILISAVPYFWLAQLLILVFAVHLRILPGVENGTPEGLILPSLVLGLVVALPLARLLRDSLLQTYQEDYVLAAQARGFGGGRVLSRHALRTSVGAVITMVGLQFGALLTGAVVIEAMFARNGIGSYLVVSMQSKDLPAVQGVVIVMAVLYGIVNLLVDIVHSFLDPKLR